MITRGLMMPAVIGAVRSCKGIPPFEAELQAVNCHHNYVAREHHYGADVLLTRKGAVRAREGDLGIIPGSMGARSYIVRGKGNPESFHSCSHGAGRAMSRNEARRRFTVVGPRAHDRGRRVPQGRRGDRRNAGGLQADRGRHGGAGRPGRGRTHTAAGGVRKGMIRNRPAGASLRHKVFFSPAVQFRMTITGSAAPHPARAGITNRWPPRATANWMSGFTSPVSNRSFGGPAWKPAPAVTSTAIRPPPGVR